MFAPCSHQVKPCSHHVLTMFAPSKTMFKPCSHHVRTMSPSHSNTTFYHFIISKSNSKFELLIRCRASTNSLAPMVRIRKQSAGSERLAAAPHDFPQPSNRHQEKRRSPTQRQPHFVFLAVFISSLLLFHWRLHILGHASS